MKNENGPVKRARGNSPKSNQSVPPHHLKPGWQKKLRERTRSEIRRREEEKSASDEQRIAAAVEAKWKRTKIRRRSLKYKTDWIGEILASNPQKNSQNFLIKMNLTREINQYMLDVMDCLVTDAMTYQKAESLVRHNRYGLKKIWVKARIGNKKRVDVERVAILVELNVPAITDRINFKRAEQGLRPIKEKVIRNTIRGLEREGFVVKVGKKCGMKGQLRCIGSFYVRQTFMINPYTEREIEVARTGRAYFWGSSQLKVREKLARLEPGK